MTIPFDNSYARLPDRFYSRVMPATVKAPRHIRINAPLASQLHIDPAWLGSAEGLGMLCGNAIVPGSEPLAQAYAGHQFGGFVPQLGDGRAILLGEVIDTENRRRDIQLKGSGRTAFSRGGDGKAALGPALREYLVSEAMHALGVPTTRALGVVSTGEEVLRQDGLLAGAVFTRVAGSHLRVGTFQYFAAREDVDALRLLTDYALRRHYPGAVESKNPALALLGSVASAQAALIAQWMGLGFIHGVMNTDNSSISGETIDYGPCAFIDAFHPQCVFSAIDRNGRYAWANQPGIAQWNLTRLAEALLPLISTDEDAAVHQAKTSLEAFLPQFGRHYHRVFGDKLGLNSEPQAGERERAFIQTTLDLLAAQRVDFTLFFSHLTRHAAGEDTSSLSAMFSDVSALNPWLAAWREVTANHPRLEAMKAANPVLIPRNHRIEQAIQAAYGNDFAPFHRLAEAWQHPFEYRQEYADLQAAPTPHEVVRQTFCGT